MPQTEELRYPTGRFSYSESELNPETIQSWIDAIEGLPSRLEKALEGMSRKQLDTPYREGGWSVRRLVHHLADSHINAFIRSRFLLTEEVPTIMPYDQDAWAKLADSDLPVDASLDILRGMHQRWAHLLKSLDEADWKKELNHPDNGIMSMAKLTAMYAWHSNHHLAHITKLKERKGW